MGCVCVNAARLQLDGAAERLRGQDSLHDARRELLVRHARLQGLRQAERREAALGSRRVGRRLRGWYVVNL